MKHTLLSLALALSLLPAAHATTSVSDPAARQVLSQIDDMEWSVRHSSVASVLSPDQQTQSLKLLSRARAEVGEGHWKTALELTRRAGQPLAAMTADAMSGKHPDAREQASDLKTTMASLLDVAEGIAREKSYPGGFVDAGRAALRQAAELTAEGKLDAANTVVAAAYARLQHEVAGLRSGDEFVLEVPRGFTRDEWSDGIRRYDERINLSRYLVIEAESQGIDTAPLLTAMTAAEASLAQATRSALENRWDQAYLALDQSYLQLEESWRKVGVEW